MAIANSQDFERYSNLGALGLIGVFLLMVAYRGNGGELWDAVKQEGGFLKWAGAVWAVYIATHLNFLRPLGPALWGVTLGAFFYQVLGGKK